MGNDTNDIHNWMVRGVGADMRHSQMSMPLRQAQPHQPQGRPRNSLNTGD